MSLYLATQTGFNLVVTDTEFKGQNSFIVIYQEEFMYFNNLYSTAKKKNKTTWELIAAVFLFHLLLFPSEQVQAEREEGDGVQSVRSAASDGGNPARHQDVRPAERGTEHVTLLTRCNSSSYSVCFIPV